MSNNTVTFPSVVIQSYMTFTAKRWGQFPTITIVGGAVAGQEYCTMAPNWDITIHIANGVSTMAQVKTAAEAGSPSLNNTSVAGDLVSLAITPTHGTDTVATESVTSLAGAVGLDTEGFYSDQSIVALTASFVPFAYPFISRVITITNDETTGSNTVAFSFDGTNLHGTLSAGQAITWDVTTGKIIWLKYLTGAPKYRLLVKGD